MSISKRVNSIINIPMSRRSSLAALSAGAVAGLVPKYGWAQGTPSRGGVLRISALANPSSLDPATGGSGNDHTFLWTIFDTLVEWDYKTLQPKPGIANWSFTDPQTMVLSLNAGVEFHDGTPCDAAAVKFNLDRGREDARSNIKPDLANVASVEIAGPREVVLRLSRPDTALPAILSDRAGMMVSPTAVRKYGAEHDRKAVGAGPWRLISWADNQEIKLVRNEKYWRTDRGFVDAIDFMIMLERATGLRSVIAGQTDLAYQLPPRLRPLIERSQGVGLVTGPTLYCRQLYMNMSRAPLDDVRVRRAMNYAVDREAFVKVTSSGLGEPAYMNLPASHWAYDPEVAKIYSYDPERARVLLREAGFDKGLELTIGGYTDADSVRRAEFMMDQFGKVGIRLRFTNGTPAEIAGQFFGQEKKFDLLLASFTGRPDPAMGYGVLYSPNSYYNAGRVEISPRVTELLGKSRASEDISERKALLSELQRIVMEEAMVIPLAFDSEMTAISERVHGYQPNLLGKPRYENVWLKQ